MRYRIHYAMYRIDASDSHEAKRKVVEMFKTNTENMIWVEIDRPERGFVKRMVLGP